MGSSVRSSGSVRGYPVEPRARLTTKTKMTGEIEVDVIHARVEPRMDLERFAAVLNAEEQGRARGYRIQESGAVFTLARGLLRLELARRLGAPPHAIQFGLRASGKPDLLPGDSHWPDWRFSVSHTGSHVALAFTRGADVGIDIERADRKTNPLDIARRYFTASELRTLTDAPEADRLRFFFAGWTRKEAIVKARGITMAESLTTLSVDLDPAAVHPGYEDAPEVEDRAACRVTAFALEDLELVGAVAVLGDQAPRLAATVLKASRFD